jgi:hypothetical protein
MKGWLLSGIVFFGVAVTSASADTITWNFSTVPNASLGTTSETYVSDGVSISASSSTVLYSKAGGGDENGLGLTCCDTDHEINPGQSIMFNLSSLFSHNVTSLTLMLGSIQSGETASVCDLDLCITFNSSDDGQAVSIMTLYTDMKAHGSGTLTITGVTGDVLVDQMQATTSSVPEPSSLLLVGNGIFMIGAGVVRKALRRR